MPDIATPNLPSRSFAATKDFYAQLGFECGYRDDRWMILHLGPAASRVMLEFFPHPDLDPYQSWFSACIRLDDLRAMMARLEASTVPCADQEIPRFHAPREEASGVMIAYMVDPDGSLIRLIQND